MADTPKKTPKKPAKSTPKKSSPAAKKKAASKAPAKAATKPAAKPAAKKMPAKAKTVAVAPVAQPKENSKKITPNRLRMGVALLALVLLVFGAVYWAKCQYKQSPNYALEQLEKAIKTQDEETVQKHVDIPTLATSIIRQVFVPQVEEATATGLGAIGNRFANSLADLVVPTLSSNLSREALNAVAAGQPEGADSLIFQRLWRSLAGTQPGNLVLLGVENVQAEGSLATADARFVRKDYEEEFVLALQMQKAEEGNWQVVDINNFQQVLSTLQDYRKAEIAAQNEEIRAQLSAALKVVSSAVSKSLKGEGKEGETPTHILLQAAFENTSGKAVSGFSTAAVLYVNGAVAKTVEIKETELLPAGEVVEKSWPYGINPFSAAEKTLYNAQPADIQANLEVTAIRFEDGTTLSLIKE